MPLPTLDERPFFGRFSWSIDVRSPLHQRNPMTKSTNPKSDSIPAGDDHPCRSSGIQAAVAGLSSIDEIIKATAAWLLIPRPGAHEQPIKIDASTFVRTDSQWVVAAQTYLDATRVLEAAAASQSVAKLTLYELTRNPQERGCGVVVTIPGRWPEIDHVEAMALLGVDPQRYWDQCVGATVSIEV
jgi:hypothetical protein